MALHFFQRLNNNPNVPLQQLFLTVSNNCLKEL